MNTYIYRNLELTATAATLLLKDIFKEMPTMSVKQVKESLHNIHVKNGGKNSFSKLNWVVKKALNNLLKDKLIESPVKGNYRLLNFEQTTTIPETNTETVPKLKITPLREIGNGSESVYVYFNSSDKELALLKGFNKWECKIGKTTGHIEDRVLNQGTRTSMARLPIVGLVIKTDNSSFFEKMIHVLLDSMGNSINEGCGVEWFLTNPQEVESIYEDLIKIKTKYTKEKK